MTPQSKRRLLRFYSRCANSDLAAVVPNLTVAVAFAFVLGLVLGASTVNAGERLQSLTLHSVVEACRK